MGEGPQSRNLHHAGRSRIRLSDAGLVRRGRQLKCAADVGGEDDRIGGECLSLVLRIGSFGIIAPMKVGVAVQSFVDAGRIARNTGLLYLQHTVTLTVDLIVVRLLLDALGVEALGVYAAVAGAIGILVFFRGALGETFCKFLSAAIGRQEDLGSVFSVVLFVAMCVAIAVVICGESLGVPIVKCVLSWSLPIFHPSSCPRTPMADKMRSTTVTLSPTFHVREQNPSSCWGFAHRSSLHSRFRRVGSFA